MKKFFASVAATVAILAGMLMATGTASATGGTTSPTFTCANVIGVGQVCEDLLNDLAVNGIHGDVDIIRADVLNLYHNEFTIPILSGNVIVIGWPTCGC
jgi:hypothetical protein